MDATDIITAIFQGQADANLDGVISQARDRQKQIALSQMRTFRPGDKVTIAQSVRPKYLAGMEGTVVTINRTTATVDLGAGVGRFAGKIKVPAQLLEAG